MIRSQTHEYFAFQYWTSVMGRGMSWWPDSGEGYFDSHKDAAKAGFVRHNKVRVLKIFKTVEYFDPEPEVEMREEEEDE